MYATKNVKFSGKVNVWQINKSTMKRHNLNSISEKCFKHSREINFEWYYIETPRVLIGTSSLWLIEFRQTLGDLIYVNHFRLGRTTPLGSPAFRTRPNWSHTEPLTICFLIIRPDFVCLILMEVKLKRSKMAIATSFSTLSDWMRLWNWSYTWFHGLEGW